MSVVVVRNLCRSYGRRRGIFDVNLTIERGEIFGFLGPNGAGKSTTLRILMGLLRATSGTASIFGQDCWNAGPAVRRQVGYVAGDVRLYPWLTLQRGLTLLSRVRSQNLLPVGLDLAERFQLEPELPVRKMSRGNRQKVALILALSHTPDLVILDEPTSGLDPLMQDTLMAYLRERAIAGHTVLFSSHTLSEVETLCDRVAIVREGRIVEDSPLTTLKAKAPRQVLITLQPGQSATEIEWPESMTIRYRPGISIDETTKTTALLVSPSLRDQVCVLELHGSSSSFLTWAASKNFADVMIGPPSLEVLFRQYYERQREVGT